MGRYRKIDTRIWNDEKFNELSDDSKLVFFMVLTHPNMTALGAMRHTIAGLAEEMGWSTEAFREAFREAFLKGMIEHDSKASVIALPNFIRYNGPESPNVVKAWSTALDLLPESEVTNRVVMRAARLAKDKGEGFAKALPEAFAKTSPKGMPNQEQEQEQEKEKKNKKKKSPSPEGSSQSSVAKINSEHAQIIEARPECVDESMWLHFVEHRKAIKAPMTKFAAERIAAKLERLRAKGDDPNESLDNSIIHGWKGVFSATDKRGSTEAPVKRRRQLA